MKAVDAAISSRQWTKAVQILEVLRDNPKSEVYYKKIADHYANIGEYEHAERYCLYTCYGIISYKCTI